MSTQPLYERAPDPTLLLESDLSRRTVLGSAERIAALALILTNFGPDIAAVRAPTLVIWGKDDPIAPLRTGKLLAARMARVRLEVIPNCGHDPMEAYPVTVAQKLLAYFALPGEDLPVAASTTSPADDAPHARCEGQKGFRLQGSFGEVQLDRCSDAVLSDVRAQRIVIRDSSVTIEGGQLTSTGVALTISRSRVKLTGCNVEGSVAIQVGGSELDAAGVHLTGHRAAIHSDGSNRIVLSVARLDSVRTHDFLHGQVYLREGDEI